MITHRQEKYSTPEPGEATGQVYTPTYTPEAQLQALEHIAQALERVATILIAWDNGARPLSVRVSNLKYF